VARIADQDGDRCIDSGQPIAETPPSSGPDESPEREAADERPAAVSVETLATAAGLDPVEAFRTGGHGERLARERGIVTATSAYEA